MALIDRTTCGVIQEEKFEKGECDVGGRKTAKSRFILWLIDRHFSVETCWSRWNVHFIGRKTDVEFAPLALELPPRGIRAPVGRILPDVHPGARGGSPTPGCPSRTPSSTAPPTTASTRGCRRRRRPRRRSRSGPARRTPCAHPDDVAHVREDLQNRYALAGQGRDEEARGGFAAISSRTCARGSLRAASTIRDHGTFTAGERAGRSISTNRPLTS